MACRSRSLSRRSSARWATRSTPPNSAEVPRVRDEQIDLQRADFKRLGVLGEWENPYRTMDFRYEADMIRALAKIRERGHVMRGFKPVYWCFDCGSALAEAEIEYQDKTSPAVDVAYDAIDPQTLAAKFGATRRRRAIMIAVPIWTTTPWTLPASVAVTLGAELDMCWSKDRARRSAPAADLVAAALAERVLRLWTRRHQSNTYS